MESGAVQGGRWSRRGALGVALAAVAATCLGDAASAAEDTDARHGVTGVGAPPGPGGWEGSYLQVIAHPDDDLYFMNPPLQRSIASGAPVATVVLTAGEADGRNSSTDAADHDSTPADKPGYTEARHNGLRSAYALMATGNQQAAWRREVVTLADGALVERCTLAEKPSVQLYFFNLAQELHGAYKAPNGTGVRLRMLWSANVPMESTLPGTGSPVDRPQDFTRDRVTACLVDLLRQHRPTLVRTLDPDPEHDPSEPGITLADHIDHTATAQFVLAALQQYTGDTGARPVVEHFRGYSSKLWPANLGQREKAEKRSYLMPYAGFGAPCPAHNCGDYQVTPDPGATSHIISTAYRYPPTTDWLVRDGEGRLHAFAVLGGRVAHWAEKTPGDEEWAAPEYLPGEWLTPRLKVLTDPSGRIQLIAMHRWSGDNGSVGVEIYRAAQEHVGGRFGAWESLGGPDYDNSEHQARREVGVPTAAFDSAGRLHVFCRNFDKGLSHRYELPQGGWSPWQRLGGGPLQDSATALTTHDGLVQVYASAKIGVLCWRQARPGGPLRQHRVSTGSPVAGAVTPVESQPGRVTLYYRESKTAQVLALRQEVGSFTWPSRPAGLGGHDGNGEVAASAVPSGRGHADVVLHRNGRQTLAVPQSGRQGLDWADSGGPLSGAPAMAQDRHGRLTVAVLGTDGRLHVTRQRGTTPGGDFGPWATA